MPANATSILPVVSGFGVVRPGEVVVDAVVLSADKVVGVPVGGASVGVVTALLTTMAERLGSVMTWSCCGLLRML